MCGISGCLSGNQNAMVSVMKALNRLQNRGYDSAGICTIIENNLKIVKYVSETGENAMQRINTDCLANVQCYTAIGHTRWATHGSKTVQNAHPHYDNKERFAMVHNGIIENYAELKEELINNGYSFYGQTDTEVAVNYLSYLVDKKQKVTDLHKIIKGAWSILVLDKQNPNKIFFMKNGSPLIIGLNNERTKFMFVSELTGFDSEIKEYFILKDDDYGYINVVDKKIKSQNIYTAIPLDVSLEETSPSPFEHWTLKEIHDQPCAISKLIHERIVFSDELTYNLNFPELDKFKNQLEETEHLIFLACGTSYHASHVGAKFFKEFRSSVTTEVIDGADFEETDIPTNRKTMLVLLSQSGETKDLYRALIIGKEKNIKSIGLINVENSLIAREVDICLYLRAGREYAVASTKSFTNQVVMLLFLAMKMNPYIDTELKNKYISSIINLPSEFNNAIKKTSAEIPSLLKYFQNQNNCFILGKHSCEWIAKEGSLKIKEISYIHSEGFSAAALKHGTFALLTHDIPVIFIANNDIFYTKLENVTSEVKSRFANIIYITNKHTKTPNVDHLLYFETTSLLFPLISIVPLQLLSYHLSLSRGNHPDYPRNLAKVVTVE